MQVNLGKSLATLGEFDELEVLFEKNKSRIENSEMDVNDRIDLQSLELPILFNKDRYDDALELVNHIIISRGMLQHPDNGSLAQDCLTKSRILRKLERYSEAIDSVLKAEALFSQQFGSKSLYVLDSKFILFTIYYIIGDNNTAKEICEEIITVIDGLNQEKLSSVYLQLRDKCKHNLQQLNNK